MGGPRHPHGDDHGSPTPQRPQQSFRCTAQLSVAPAASPRRDARTRRSTSRSVREPPSPDHRQHRYRLASRRPHACRCTRGTAGKWVVGTPGPGIRNPRLQQDRRTRAGGDERRRRQHRVRRDGIAVAIGLRVERVRMRRHQRLAQESVGDRGVLLHRAARRLCGAHGASGQRRRHRRRVLPRAAATLPRGGMSRRSPPALRRRARANDRTPAAPRRAPPKAAASNDACTQGDLGGQVRRRRRHRCRWRRSARAMAATSNRTCRPRASCARARRRT